MVTGLYPDWDEIDRRLAEARLRHAEYMARFAHLGGFGCLWPYAQAVYEARNLLDRADDRMRAQWITGERAAAPPVGYGVRQIADET